MMRFFSTRRLSAASPVTTDEPFEFDDDDCVDVGEVQQREKQQLATFMDKERQLATVTPASGRLAKLRQNAGQVADKVCLELYVFGQTALAVVKVAAEVGLDATEAAASGCIIVASIPVTMLATFPIVIGSGVALAGGALATCQRPVQVAVIAGSTVTLGGIALGLANATSPLLATLGVLNATWNLALPLTSAAAAAVSLGSFAGAVKCAASGNGVLPMVRSATQADDWALMCTVGALTGAAILAPQALILAVPAESQGAVAAFTVVAQILPSIIESASLAFTTGLWFAPAATLQVAAYTGASLAGGLSVGLFCLSLGTRFKAEAEVWDAPLPRASHHANLSDTTQEGVLNRVLIDNAPPEAVLGIPNGTELNRRVIERAYKTSALNVHPDKCDNARAAEAFNKVEDARDVLLRKVDLAAGQKKYAGSRTW